MANESLSRKDLADIVAGDKFRETLIPRADALAANGNYPLWHGWAIMDAFLAGATYARSERGQMSPQSALRQLRRELKQHWLTGIACDDDIPRHTDRTRSTCYCSTWRSPPMATVGGALEAWIDHLFEKAGFAGLDEELPESSERKDS